MQLASIVLLPLKFTTRPRAPHTHTTISALLEYRVGDAIENNVARESLEHGLSQKGYGTALRYLLNHIKIRNKFSRFQYVKEPGGFHG
jgi:hypothetical protein